MMTSAEARLAINARIKSFIGINQARKDFGEKPVRLNDFNNRIADELSDDHYESFVVQNTNNT